jgi:hypothetical protein
LTGVPYQIQQNVFGSRLYTGGIILDVSSSTNPFVSQTLSNATSSVGTVVGSFAYTFASSTNSFLVYDMHGLTAIGLKAPSASLGSLSVFNDATISGSLSVAQSLSVGYGGIFSYGSLNLYSSSTYATSTFLFNSASNTIPVLEIRGGCDNGNTGGDLILAGNTTDIRKFSVRCDGSTYADGTYNSTGGDIAEYYQTSSTLFTPVASSSTLPSPGTVISFHASFVGPSSSGTRSSILGVIPTKPGFVGNSHLRNTFLHSNLLLRLSPCRYPRTNPHTC